jgi:hypothetical protein
LRGPIRWWRDRRDPFRDLEPLELPSKERPKGNTELRDYLEDIAAADARGGPEEVLAMYEERHVRQRGDIRFRREGRQLWIAVAALIVAGAGIVVTLATR